MAFTPNHQTLINGLRLRLEATGRFTSAEFDALVAVNTGPDGAVNWPGVLTFLQGLVADLPQILAFINALIPLFGG